MPYKDKEDRNAQARRWGRENRDKTRESVSRWRSENRESVRANERTYYERNRERHLANNKLKRQKRIDYLFERLGDCCCQCGSKDRLEFDHIDPEHKTTRTPPQAMGKELVDKEIPNLQVLCHECHQRKTNAQRLAAWHLFCQLSPDEQSELADAFLDVGGKRTNLH